MHNIGLLNSEDKCIIANKDEEERKTLIRVRPMVTKSFDHLRNKFNSLNTMLRKIKNTRSPIFNEDVHMINFLQLVRLGLSGRRRPLCPWCYVKYNNVLLPVNVIKFNIGHLCLLCRPPKGFALLGK